MNKINLRDLGITFEYKFVPWSQSRFRLNKNPSLNWEISLFYKRKLVLNVDYTAGMGHAPAYKHNDQTLYNFEKVLKECETGIEYTIRHGKRNKILPNPNDVMYSLLLDAEVIDYASFEDWASSMGVDTDSRKAENDYKACLKIALQLRAGLGQDLINHLKEMFQDY